MPLLKQPQRKKIDDEIEHCLVVMGKMSPESEDYTKATQNLHRLCEAKKNKSEHRLDWNTVLLVSASVVEVFGVIFREELGHVITSKAIGFIIKGGRI